MAHKPYFINNKRVPSVTTILGKFKDPTPLNFWAYKTGIEHESMRREGLGCPSGLHDTTYNTAARIGTEVHNAIEHDIRQRTFSGQTAGQTYLDDLMWSADERAAAQSGYDAYLTWQKMSRLNFIYTELSMVGSNAKGNQFGGTLDAIGEFEGKYYLVDWKTSNGVYADYLLQLAAYGMLVETGVIQDALAPLGIKLSGYHLCRFSKENGDFSHHFYETLENEKKAFVKMLQLYELMLIIGKRCK